MTTSRTFAQWIKDLVAKKCLRPLDYQFAKFVASVETQYPDEVMWLSALVSAQLGQGHICVNLDSDLTEQALMPSPDLIGLYGAAAAPLEDKVAKVDWSVIIEKASTISQLVAESTQLATVTPLVWQHHRLYLQRYFAYEQTIAERLLAMATPIELSTSQIQSAATMLDQLFAREYHYLYTALANQSKASGTQVSRQQVVCDFLDVIDEQAIDWERVESVLSDARSASDLQSLDNVIPLTACLNWQKVAAAVALTRRFAVISGGPGTGKTTTVTKLLAAMVNQANQQGESPTIKLVAPTGKAAARLTESIGKAVDSLALDPELKASIPTESSTLHRLLGAIPGRVEFRHNQSNPLHLDVLVLDEASMVDLPMMHRLLDALPAHARLILLGDKDQLASVEAGAVLSDICDFLSHGYSAKQNDRIRALTQFDCQRGEEAKTSVSPLADSLCVLQKSYRFDARSGIGQLAKQVNAASSRGFEQVWQKGFDDIEWMALSGDSYQKLIDRLVRAYQPYLTDARNASPASESLESHEALVNWQQSLARSVLNAFAKARLLCAVRDGDFGVTGLNQRTESRLKQRGLIPRGEELWYVGRPLMVTKNDHGLGLYNGDIGICLWDFRDRKSVV